MDDLELTLGHLTVRGKGRKVRQVPLTARVSAALRTWLSLRGGLGAVSPALLLLLSHRNVGGRLTTKGARDIAQRYYQALGLPPSVWGLHTLRRTAGTQLYCATRDSHVVVDVLGHASVNTSAIYAKMDVSVRREALEAAERLVPDCIYYLRRSALAAYPSSSRAAIRAGTSPKRIYRVVALSSGNSA